MDARKLIVPKVFLMEIGKGFIVFLQTFAGSRALVIRGAKVRRGGDGDEANLWALAPPSWTECLWLWVHHS